MRIYVPCGAEVAASVGTGTPTLHLMAPELAQDMHRTQAKARTRAHGQNVNAAQNTKRGGTDTNGNAKSSSNPQPTPTQHQNSIQAKQAQPVTAPYKPLQAPALSRSSAVTNRVVKRRAVSHCANLVGHETASVIEG